MTREFASGVLAFLLSATPLLARPQAEPAARTSGAATLTALESWRAAHGDGWRIEFDRSTSRAQFVYGASAQAPFEPSTESDRADLALFWAEATQPLTGIEPASLVLDDVALLPFGLIGSTDKWTVRFRQEVNGLPVLGGFLNVLTDVEGRLLSVQSTALPDVLSLPTTPAIDAASAADAARQAFRAKHGLAPTEVGEPLLAVAGHQVGKRRVGVLVWQVVAFWRSQGAEPIGTTYWIDARDGAVLRAESAVHHFDVGGSVTTLTSPPTLPDISSNPEQPAPMPYARVTSSAGTVTTDANGDFNFAGVSGPLTCTFTYYGTFADVRNVAGAEYSLGVSLSGTGNSVQMNPSAQAAVTAQANAYRGIVELRDWIRSVNPSDATGDFRAVANTNLNDTCNAYYDGVSVNFFAAGGGCVNTSYSSVVVHEMGHWLNSRYGTGNGSDGMGEGNADVFSMYLYDDPVVGRNFFTSGGFIRSGNNSRLYCGDGNPGCYGEVHADGEVWMGAAWKVRANLKSTNGTQAGGAIADGLFIGWLNAYDQTSIHSVIETQWLTLDDDDGNIGNGTPHYADIDAGFRAQGFPGFDLEFVNITNVTQLPNTPDEVGPYDVSADLVANFNPPVASAEVRYRVQGGPWLSVPMGQGTGNTWTGSIPGQSSPARVDYYVLASDALGNSDTYPANAPDESLSFYIGQIETIYATGFEGANDGGWTHASFGDTSNSQDDWQRGAPNGSSGDPSGPFAGANCWGNDLAPPGWNGAYQPNVHNYLRSPVIDASQASNVVLRFRRWLQVEKGIYDQARVKVNGVLVWSNDPAVDHLDTAWVLQEIDISSLADGNPSVTIEFSLQSDAGLEFGGWNIDELELLSVAPSNSCATPTNYGTGKTNSLGYAAELFSSGTPSVASGDFAIVMDLAVPNQPSILFSGSAPDSTPAFGGTRLVAPPLQRGPIVITDFLGGTVTPIPVTSGMVGTTRYYQQWYRDPADSVGVGLSNGLQVTFCE